MVHSGERLDLEVLLATLVNHLLLFLPLNRHISILVVLNNDWGRLFSGSPVFLVLYNFACLKLHFIELLRLLFSPLGCFLGSDLVKCQALLILLLLARFFVNPIM